jgi:hypothetical protein
MINIQDITVDYAKPIFVGFFVVVSFFFIIFMGFLDQAQASDQFLATNKLATNKAVCLKTKKRNKG